MKIVYLFLIVFILFININNSIAQKVRTVEKKNDKEIHIEEVLEFEEYKIYLRISHILSAMQEPTLYRFTNKNIESYRMILLGSSYGYDSASAIRLVILKDRIYIREVVLKLDSITDSENYIVHSAEYFMPSRLTEETIDIFKKTFWDDQFNPEDSSAIANVYFFEGVKNGKYNFFRRTDPNPDSDDPDTKLLIQLIDAISELSINNITHPFFSHKLVEDPLRGRGLQ